MNLFDLPSSVSMAQLLCAAFLAVLFLQSGIDKIIDWKGNLDWLTSHFATSPLKNLVPVMLATVTVFEVLSGLLSGFGVIASISMQDSTYTYAGALLSATSIVMLFFGQRMAKDYAGAASLVPYFLVCIAAIMLHS